MARKGGTKDMGRDLRTHNGGRGLKKAAKRAPVIVLGFSLIALATGCSEEVVAEAEPGLMLSCRPTSLNIAEYGEHSPETAFCTVTPTNTARLSRVEIEVVPDYEVAEELGVGETAAEGGLVGYGVGEDSVDLAYEITYNHLLEEDNQPGRVEFGCKPSSVGLAQVRATLRPKDGEAVSVSPTTITCFDRNPERFALGIRSKEASVPLSSRVQIEIEATDPNGGKHVANQMVKVAADANGGLLEGADEKGESQVVLVHDKAREMAIPASPVYYTCPSVEGLFRVNVGFADQETNGLASASAYVNCTNNAPQPEVKLNSGKAVMIADGLDTMSVGALVLGPEGPVAPDDEHPIDVELCADGGASFLHELAEYVGCASCNDDYDPRQECSRVVIPVDANGTISTELQAGTTPGTVLISATANLSTLEYVVRNPDEFEGGRLIVHGDLAVNQVGVGGIQFQGATPQILGVRGGGFNESSQVCFRMYDTEGSDLPAGVAVEFDIPNNVGSAAVNPTITVTDPSGIACTTLQAGTVATIVTIRATVRLGAGANANEVSVESSAVPIIGVKPSAGNWAFSCDVKNVGAFLESDGLHSLVMHEIPCRTTLTDRFGNPVGLSTAISFRSEAGSIGGSVNTVPLATGGDLSRAQPDVGKAVVIFNTFGALPKDVTPWPPPQRQGTPIEPRTGDGPLYRNPRDGLVSLLAFVAGEEEFVDANGNGQYDAGEPFVDLSEPFVDYDDDDVRDDDEPFIDIDLPGNSQGVHDSENGTWDGNTIIWTQTRMLYSGSPTQATVRFRDDGVSLDGCAPFANEACGGNRAFYVLRAGTSCRVITTVSDSNGNLLNSSASYTWELDGGQIFETGQPTIVDTYGIDWRLILVPVPGQDGVSRIRTQISDWGTQRLGHVNDEGGRDAWVNISAASEAPEPGAEPITGFFPSTLRLTVTYSTMPGGSSFFPPTRKFETGCVQ